jgi:hypothetical protein
VLAVGLDALEHRTVDPIRVCLEPALRTGHPHGVSHEELGVVAGDAVDGVALWHVGPERTMATA